MTTEAPEIEEATYNERPRHLEAGVIDKLELHPVEEGSYKISSASVTLRGSWSFGVAPEHVQEIYEGQTVLLETVNLSLITGLATYDFDTGEIEWLYRKSDQDLKREHEEMIARHRERDAKALEKNREEYLRREGALPLALRRRLDRFHANGGEEFKMSGWGYELIISELAVMYARICPEEGVAFGEDSEEISEFAREQGTSGNQHDFAKMVARWLISNRPDADDTIAAMPAGLTPITGDADYSKAGKGEI